MRLPESNKAIGTAPNGVSCRGQHRLYLGEICPSCGVSIPFGPFSFKQWEAMFGKAVNEPPIRTPSPEHVAAQAKYLFEDRSRTSAIGEVARLEDELAQAQMSTSELTVSGNVRNKVVDMAHVARLSEKVAAAREARDAADERAGRALRTANRIRA